MSQYGELKAQGGDALLLFRMGDFYELFGDDAIVASKILGLTLTSRDKNKENPLPMAGMPFHSVDSYIQKLLKAGHKVAIGEQVEDPEEARKRGAKSIVRREVVRVFTPAVNFDGDHRDAAYLALPFPADGKKNELILLLLDASTGEARFSEPLTREALLEELQALSIPHILKWGPNLSAEELKIGQADRLVEELPANYLSPVMAQKVLKEHFSLASLDAFLPSPEAAHGLGILVAYACRSLKKERLEHLKPPSALHTAETLALGARTASHLDLVPGSEGSPNLFSLLDTTATALGSRQLKRWVLEPLARPESIQSRQTTVRELTTEFERASKIRKALAEVYDLDRLLGRITAGLANPRDTWALGRSLGQAPEILAVLDRLHSPAITALRADLESDLPKLAPLAERVLRTQRPEPPFAARDGDIFLEGTSPELDRLLHLSRDGQQWLIELEARERAATGIPSLKVRYNRVFGYYIEVTQTHLKSVPSHYLRKQTTVGGERFFTEELKKFEDDFLNAASRQQALEIELFDKLIRTIQGHTPSIMRLAQIIGELDALLALAKIAERPGWCFPEIDDSLELEIEAGRHPLVDEAAGGQFVPNSVTLIPGERQCLLITGPNMGGKSTVMRQVALIVILGQMGAPIPARRGRWGWVSSVHTRIGAHDAISRGQSTFMVEMIELAQILHRADHRSLIILDEIGRGTSTYDGMSVAWATVEWIAKEIRARTLFATHYHELTRLPRELPGVANAHMAVDSGRRNQLRFLYELRDGPTNESFGIQVAALAGLPKPVIARAWKVLEHLEAEATRPNETNANQLSLFDSLTEPDPQTTAALELAQDVNAVDPNQMTPIQALTFLVSAREKWKSLSS